MCNACGLKWKRTNGGSVHRVRRKPISAPSSRSNNNSSSRSSTSSSGDKQSSSGKRRRARKGLDVISIAAPVSDASQRVRSGASLGPLPATAVSASASRTGSLSHKRSRTTRPTPPSTLRRIVREELDDMVDSLGCVLEGSEPLAPSTESNIALDVHQQQLLIDEVKRLRNELEKKDRLIDRLYASLEQRDKTIGSLPADLTLNWNVLTKILPT